MLQLIISAAAQIEVLPQHALDATLLDQLEQLLSLFLWHEHKRGPCVDDGFDGLLGVVKPVHFVGLNVYL